MARGEEEEVSIFNMSFLDVFCCTVGALIFILLILVLITRDMVERTVLDETTRKLANARTELAATEKARDETKAELADIEAKVRVSQQEIRVRDRRIEQLVAHLQDPEDSGVDALASPLPSQSQAAPQQPGGQPETQKQERGQYLLGNLETKAIVCSGDALYLGRSRKPVMLHHRDLDQVFQQFLRYHQPDQEGLWRTSWGTAPPSYRKSIQLERANEEAKGTGLVVRADPHYAAAAEALRAQDVTSVKLDLDGDGTQETLYEDSNGDGSPDAKRVNVDHDAFFEEVYLAFDEGRGQWGQVLVDSDGDDQHDLLLKDRDSADTDYEEMYVLPNLQTGKSVLLYEDRDNDGLWDVKYENTDLANETWEQTYALFNPKHRRWGALLADTNEDGQPDILWRDTDMSNDDWEEKQIDTNADGQWDIRWQDLDPRDNDWEAKFTDPKPGTEIWGRCDLDSDADGSLDAVLLDRNGDGEWDEEE
jgi:hypothetical protein